MALFLYPLSGNFINQGVSSLGDNPIGAWFLFADHALLANAPVSKWPLQDYFVAFSFSMLFQRQKVSSKLTLVIIHTLMQVSVVNTVVVSLNLLLSAQYVRLREGTVANEGRVEVDVGRNGMWQTVCDVDWDLIDADVVCKELGYHYAISAVAGAHFGQGTGAVWRGANCTGGESSIAACPPALGAVCVHSMDAGVVCSTSGKYSHRLYMV